MFAPLYLAATLVASALPPCSGAAPAITSAALKSAATDGALKHYVVAITVMNQGNARQPGNLLQSVDVFQDGVKVGKIGLQPLKPSQTQTVTYGFDRALDAGDGTTHLKLMLDFNGMTGSMVNCRSSGGAYRLDV